MTNDSGVPSKAVLSDPEIRPNVGGDAPEAALVPTNVGTEMVGTPSRTEKADPDAGMKILKSPAPPTPKKGCRHCHGTGRIGYMPVQDQYTGKATMAPVRCRCVTPKPKK
jgi:hypothetical protein